MTIELLQAIADYLATINYGMNASNFEWFTSWYWSLGGADCTTDLDRVHQGRYVALYILNVLAYLLTGRGDVFTVCEVI